jgi:hypothetical protein
VRAIHTIGGQPVDRPIRREAERIPVEPGGTGWYRSPRPAIFVCEIVSIGHRAYPVTWSFRLGRQARCQGEGRGFEPRRPLHGNPWLGQGFLAVYLRFRARGPSGDQPARLLRSRPGNPSRTGSACVPVVSTGCSAGACETPGHWPTSDRIRRVRGDADQRAPAGGPAPCRRRRRVQAPLDRVTPDRASLETGVEGIGLDDELALVAVMLEGHVPRGHGQGSACRPAVRVGRWCGPPSATRLEARPGRRKRTADLDD